MMKFQVKLLSILLLQRACDAFVMPISGQSAMELCKQQQQQRAIPAFIRQDIALSAQHPDADELWYAKIPSEEDQAVNVNTDQSQNYGEPATEARFGFPQDMWNQQSASEVQAFQEEFNQNSEDFSSIFKFASSHPSTDDMDVETFSTLIDHAKNVYL